MTIRLVHPAVVALLICLTGPGCRQPAKVTAPSRTTRTEPAPAPTAAKATASGAPSAASSPAPLTIPDTPDAQLRATRRQKVALPEPRPVLPVRQTEPCVLSGTLHAAGNLRVRGQGGLIGIPGYAEVERLVVPRSEEAPVAHVAWPIEGDFELAGPSPFATQRKVELAPGHVWLGAGVRVKARHGETRVFVALGSGTGFEPAQAELTCSDLTLAQTPAPAEPPPEMPDATRLAAAPVPLAAKPSGPRVAIVDGRYYPHVEILARQGSFSHVRADGDYGLDGWVPTRMISEPEGALFGVGSPSREVPQFGLDVVASLPVRLAPSDGAPVLGRLPVGQRLLLTSDRERYVGLRIADAYAGNETGEFFALRTEVEVAIGRPGALQVGPGARPFGGLSMREWSQRLEAHFAALGGTPEQLSTSFASLFAPKLERFISLQNVSRGQATDTTRRFLAQYHERSYQLEGELTRRGTPDRFTLAGVLFRRLRRHAPASWSEVVPELSEVEVVNSRKLAFELVVGGDSRALAYQESAVAEPRRLRVVTATRGYVIPFVEGCWQAHQDIDSFELPVGTVLEELDETIQVDGCGPSTSLLLTRHQGHSIWVLWAAYQLVPNPNGGSSLGGTEYLDVIRPD